MKILKRILIPIFVFFCIAIIGILVGYQIKAEVYLKKDSRTRLGLIEKKRQRYSLWVIYELRKMFDRQFARKEIDYVNWIFYKKEDIKWSTGIDFYIMDQYYNDLEKDSVLRECNFPPPPPYN